MVKDDQWNTPERLSPEAIKKIMKLVKELADTYEKSGPISVEKKDND